MRHEHKNTNKRAEFLQASTGALRHRSASGELPPMTRPPPDPDAARIVVHGYDHAVAALEAARGAGAPVTILSAPGAARSGGPAWWRELAAQAGAAVPGAEAEWILDCADEAGTALAALREGVTHIALECEPAVRARVYEIAAQTGAVLANAGRAEALDLAGSNNPQRDCANHLSGHPGAVAKPGALG